MTKEWETVSRAILEVSGEGCANCLTLLPVLNALSAEKGIPLFHLEAEEGDLDEIRALQIERVPAVLLFEQGTEIARCYGFQPEEILSLWLDAKFSL